MSRSPLLKEPNPRAASQRRFFVNSLTGRLRPDEVRSIAVFRALQLGDMLCTVPAFRALRAAFPSARITLIGLPWAEEFVRRFHLLIDDFLAFPGYPGLPERKPDLDELPRFFHEARRRHFDLALQLHGSGSIVNRVVEKIEAHRTAGFFVHETDRGTGGLYMKWPEAGHEIRRFLSLLEFLGIPSQGEHLEFPIGAEDRAEGDALLRQHGLEAGAYVCLHPGARLRSRRWPTDRFAEVGDALSSLGHRVVVTGAPSERELAAAVCEAMSHTAINLAGRTSLGAMAALVKGARLLVSNDTGVSHIATAVGTPSVVVTMGSDPARWSPLDRSRHVPVSVPIDCRPCGFDECPIGHPCATGIAPSLVIEKAREQLQRRLECVL